MNSIDFCYWLQGAFEVTNAKQLTEEQTQIVKNHLNLVFKHEIDPLRDSESLSSKIDLGKTHGGNDTLVRC